MVKNTLYVLLIAALLATPHAKGTKARRNKRPKIEDESTPQPSVVSYSTFGFNDVGSYDGFVPTSPDYASFLSNGNTEASTRLYAPAFPSASDSTGFNSNFGQPNGYDSNDENGPQPSMMSYPQNSMNFFSTPSFDNSEVQNKNHPSNEANGQNLDGNGPVYGAKISSKNKKFGSNYNNSEFNVYSGGPMFNDMSPFSVSDKQLSRDSKANYGESSPTDQNSNNYPHNFPSSDIEEMAKSPTNPQNAIKFPRVVDFTKIKQYYPSELDNKYQVETYSAILNNHNENYNNNMFKQTNENQSNKFIKPTPTFKESSIKTKPVVEESEPEFEQPNFFHNLDNNNNFVRPAPTKNSPKEINYNSDYKDNYKHKWNPETSIYDSKNPRNPFKGYEYATNYSNTSFKYEYVPDRKPFKTNIDEVVPASSNIDLTGYNYPDADFLGFKKMPEVKNPFDDDFETQHGDKFKSEEFLNSFKNLYTTTPTSSSQWGSFFKTSDFSEKPFNKKPQYDDGINSEIVHIPKRPRDSFKYNYGKYSDSKPNEYIKTRPYKYNKFEKPSDWSKEVFNTRFKSEEDLMGLRNHDTSNPSYLPYSRPSSNEVIEQNDYKKLVDKWRQSYLKTKYKQSYRDHDFDSYASEEKPLHVPIPKPYSIEVPHPVIVPVPQPYPVRVPVPKPVAVPVIRELTVPIEKPVPYPVVKKVPYPVVKLVPVPVEKEVPIPVMKPYPVHIPHIRPVFHHSRPPREEYSSDFDADDDDYSPRPEGGKKIQPYKKRPKSTRNYPPRRPTRVPYHHYRDRSTSKRGSPTGARPSEIRARSPATKEYYPYRNRDHDDEGGYDGDHSDYYRYCKRTGNC